MSTGAWIEDEALRTRQCICITYSKRRTGKTPDLWNIVRAMAQIPSTLGELD
jgi:hypothetical protein